MEPLKKIKDKSEKERSALTRKIIELEEKEDDFRSLQKRHEDVQIHFDDIEKLSKSFRRNTDEQRDKLISERNQLPWE